MSKIDEGVVSLKFDNKQFESGIRTTLNSLKNLRESLKNGGGKQAFKDISDGVKNVDMGKLNAAVETVKKRFSLLGIAGVTALVNIANKAVDAGLRFANSFTLQPIKDGFSEYELKMSSIQTILANTARHGTTLKDVTKVLDELNAYSDKTIYNFGDMTKNIGLFTNAGLKIEESAKMIQGFSNAAAASGTSAEGASHAAYQLSQALSAGKITLMDWKSLTNVGMGNKNMQDGLLNIAIAMGKVEKGSAKAADIQKDFNASLKDGWLSTDIMSNYLQILAEDNEDVNRAKMKQLGLSNAQIDAFIKEQKTAAEAATKIRTWSQLVGTVKEQLGSIYAKTFEYILGDFNTATTLFTGIGDAIGKITGGLDKALNDPLKKWVDTGGRAAAIEGLSRVFRGLGDVLKPIGQAFREVFKPLDGAVLTKMSVQFNNFTKSFKMGSAVVEGIKNTFKGFFVILHLGLTILGGLGRIAAAVFGVLLKGSLTAGGGLATVTGYIGQFVSWVERGITSGKALSSVLGFLSPVIKVLQGWFGKLNAVLPTQAEVMERLRGIVSDLRSSYEKAEKKIAPFVARLQELFNSFKADSIQAIKDAATSLEKFGAAAGRQYSAFKVDALDAYSSAAAFLGRQLDTASKKTEGFVAAVKKAGDSIKNAFSGAKSEGLKTYTADVESSESAFDRVQGFADALGNALKSLWNQLKKIGPLLSTVGNGISETIGWIKEQFQAIFKDFDATDYEGVFNLAALTAAFLAFRSFVNHIKSFSESIEKVAESLSGTLDATGNALNAFALKTKAQALVQLGLALLVLSVGLIALSYVDPKKLAAASVAMGVLVAELAALMAVMKKLSSSGEESKGVFDSFKNNMNLVATAVGLILFAGALALMATAVKKLASIDTKTIGQGLVSLGIVMAYTMAFLNNVEFSSNAMSNGVALLLIAAAMHVFAGAIKKLADMSITELVTGITSLAAIFLVLGASFRLMGGGDGMIKNAVAIAVLAISLSQFQRMVQKFADMPLGDIAKGLGTIAITFVLLAAAMRIMPKDAAVIGLSVATAITAIAVSMSILASVPIAMLIKAIGAIAVVLAILVVAVNAFSGAVVGVAGILAVAAALAILTPVLMALGSMSWEAIAKGLLAIAGAILVLGVGAAILGIISPLVLLLSVALVALGVGLLGAGAGMMLFSVGLAQFGATLLVSGGAFLAFLAGLIALLPSFGTAIGSFVVNLTSTILSAIPGWVAAFGQILTAILKVIANAAPQLANTMLALLTAGLSVIVRFYPRLVNAGIQLIIALLTGIRNNIGKIVTLAMQIMMNFLNAIARNIPGVVRSAVNIIIAFINAISANIPRIVQAAANLIVNFINSLSTGIDRNAPRIRTAMKNLGNSMIKAITGGLNASEAIAKAKQVGKDIVNGMIAGVNALKDTLKRTASNLAKSAIDGAKSMLKINSPSKVFRDEVGKSIPEGFAMGITQNAGMVRTASENMAKSTIQTVKDAMTNIGDELDGGMNLNPTITPVMDLSQIREGMSGLKSAIGTGTPLAVGINATATSRGSRGEVGISGANVYNHYEQHITAPQGLNTLDVYRNSKTLLNMDKR